ncbi:hypothetical protein SODALDRAFT_132801 [Sodiomyces alkalinus F11]|uniref:Uncharacterized protein n=1 Tax=Sodiomyces alkalinus (strain CBS 110278 / VKM F-3762 / F11) TaxID=1314773 RepID=A0A3N2PYF6_SODAK|nr:hypothetical protein SODALDRAFT_132801 [Sodiomyces alkalinus F11]ROT39571.1 hypothetical protein SODALDRAFT_132801 [Sodiomyces alkalinus F11]
MHGRPDACSKPLTKADTAQTQGSDAFQGHESRSSIVVIGAGLVGLPAAIRLSSANSRPGVQLWIDREMRPPSSTADDIGKLGSLVDACILVLSVGQVVRRKLERIPSQLNRCQFWRETPSGLPMSFAATKLLLPELESIVFALPSGRERAFLPHTLRGSTPSCSSLQHSYDGSLHLIGDAADSTYQDNFLQKNHQKNHQNEEKAPSTAPRSCRHAQTSFDRDTLGRDSNRSSREFIAPVHPSEGFCSSQLAGDDTYRRFAIPHVLVQAMALLASRLVVEPAFVETASLEAVATSRAWFRPHASLDESVHHPVIRV